MRHDLLMLTAVEESWTTCGFDAIEQIIEQEIQLFNESVRVKKLDNTKPRQNIMRT